MSNPDNLSASELSKLLRAKKISVREVVTCALKRIEQTKELNNFITLTAVDADIDRAQNMIDSGSAPLLCGLPVAVKDNIEVAGYRTTCASKLFADRISERDSSCVKLIRSQGGIIIGKTNMDELAMGSTNESSCFGAIKNYIDRSRVPGGSSGGSANCVCAGQVPLALGTDTGGSIRQPAAYCGVFGLKPTHALAEKYCDGLIGFSPSLDTVGFLTATADDAMLMLDAFYGGLTCGNVHTVGVDFEFIKSAPLSAAAIKAFEQAISALEKGGAVIKQITLPPFSSTLAAYHVLSSSEASARLTASYRDSLYLAGDEVKRRVITGAIINKQKKELLSAAKDMRSKVRAAYGAALDECDFILTPSTLSAAIKLGEASDPQKAHCGDYFLAGVSLAGLPALSVPFGSDGVLPLGIQLVGKSACEKTLLCAAKKYFCE